MKMSRKVCPLLVQSETNPSLTMKGQSWTRTYFTECLGEKCAAYHSQDNFCEKFRERVDMKEAALEEQKGEKYETNPV